jgi:hypothetical protein
MNFFCTEKHYLDWTSKRSVDEANVFCLDAHEAMLVARMIFWVDA